MCRNYFIICVVFSLWTIVQTGLHLVFVIYTYFMSICQRTPTQIGTIFFYLTYLYKHNCPSPVLKDPGFLNAGSLETYALGLIKYTFPTNNTNTLDAIVTELLEKINLFPETANASSKTSIFLLSFIILDGTWIISAVALLMGTSFGIQQSLSLVFYVPWLIMTVCVSIFDVSAAVAFGLDVPETSNFANWFKFVGVEETSEFEDFDRMDLPFYVPLAPTLSLCFLSTRFVLVWISNWIGFFYVLKAAIARYRKKYRKPQLHRSHQTGFNSSAARIRSWQLFYGAIETTSSHSSKSTSAERDFNSNSKENEDVEMQRVPSVSDNLSSCYHAYSDVAEHIEGGGSVCLEELRGQLPWSYIPAQENRGEGANEKKRNYRLKSDSSASGTEL